MSLVELKNHLEIQTKNFNENKNNLWLITSSLTFDHNLYPDCIEEIKNHKLNGDYKWVIYKLAKHKKLLVLEIISDTEIERKKLISGKNNILYIGNL